MADAGTTGAGSALPQTSLAGYLRALNAALPAMALCSRQLQACAMGLLEGHPELMHWATAQATCSRHVPDAALHLGLGRRLDCGSP